MSSGASLPSSDRGRACRSRGRSPWGRRGIGAAALLLLCSCRPPPTTPGLISFTPRQQWNGDLSFSGGALAAGRRSEHLDPVGGAAAHLDLYLTRGLSLPVDLLMGGDPMSTAARVGIRQRFRGHLALGAGVGPSANEYWSTLSTDLEIAVGGRFGRVAFSLAVRPSISCNTDQGCDPLLWATTDLSVGFYLSTRVVLTLHAVAAYGFAIKSDIGSDEKHMWGAGGGAGLLLHF